ncbi:hypothetical protein K469DRAFT_705888 [Zopfia rhizophila CBS 207.26]|uniref:WD40 repeat-like protein n=1 Tax=Zopfia rhizophila CBS 207.26 TaxID=1314779 RepID=A0A6A6EUH5_9PEZI|nr:hypothetical protein K469DRAFT_705888 [Zopfia rhizophila CBS 207.26]
MESIEISHQFKTTSHSFSSPTATHTASLSGSRLQIRSLATLEITRSIILPNSHDLRNSRLAWSPPTTSTYSTTSTPPRRSQPVRSNRILVADDETTRVYDLRDEKWSAVIRNGSGGMGKNVHVEFGRNEEEVVVWSDFQSKVSVWCLRTGRTVEVKDPKIISQRERGWGWGWGWRPGDGEKVLACLCRSGGQDVLLLMAPGSYKVLKRVELGTVDAQGLRWSRDGRWVSVWDSPGSGFRVQVYTADGHLYRTINREPQEESREWGIGGLGVKSVEWVPGGEWLAVGGWDRRVRMLSSRTFSPVVFLDHTAQIQIPSAPVYTEQVPASGVRSYAVSPQPVSPPTAQTTPNDTVPKQGISIITFNADSTLVATRDDSTPTTVWIWDLRSLSPKTILIQHAPVKSLQWHPTNPSLLLIQCIQDTPILYLWSAPSLSTSTSQSSSPPPPPEILDLNPNITKPLGSATIKWDVKWLSTFENKKPCFLFGHQQGYILVWPEGREQILRFENEEDEESEDSLYDILTGRTPVPRLHDSSGSDLKDEENEDGGTYAEGETYSSGEGSTRSLEDTFRERKKVNPGVGRKKSVFDESGMSEMF